MASQIQPTMHFAEILSEDGHRIYIGVIMAAGNDWVEVSSPPALVLASMVFLRFVPAEIIHGVTPSWQKPDRTGFTYLHGGPPEDHFSGMPGIYDPLPASMKRKQAS